MIETLEKQSTNMPAGEQENNNLKNEDMGRRIETPEKPIIPAYLKQDERKEKTQEEKDIEKRQLDMKQEKANEEAKALEKAKVQAKARMGQMINELSNLKNFEQLIKIFFQFWSAYIVLIHACKSIEQVEAVSQELKSQYEKLAKANNIDLSAEQKAEKATEEQTGNNPAMEGIAPENITAAMPSVASAPETNGVTEVTIDEVK